MKKILVAGCSYTKYKWPSWSSYVGWFDTGYDIKNLGDSGSSNEIIMRTVYNSINKWKSSVEKVYIYVVWNK